MASLRSAFVALAASSALGQTNTTEWSPEAMTKACMDAKTGADNAGCTHMPFDAMCIGRCRQFFEDAANFCTDEYDEEGATMAMRESAEMVLLACDEPCILGLVSMGEVCDQDEESHEGGRDQHDQEDHDDEEDMDVDEIEGFCRRDGCYHRMKMLENCSHLTLYDLKERWGFDLMADTEGMMNDEEEMASDPPRRLTHTTEMMGTTADTTTKNATLADWAKNVTGALDSMCHPCMQSYLSMFGSCSFSYCIPGTPCHMKLDALPELCMDFNPPMMSGLQNSTPIVETAEYLHFLCGVGEDTCTVMAARKARKMKALVKMPGQCGSEKSLRKH